MLKGVNEGFLDLGPFWFIFGNLESFCLSFFNYQNRFIEFSKNSASFPLKQIPLLEFFKF